MAIEKELDNSLKQLHVNYNIIIHQNRLNADTISTYVQNNKYIMNLLTEAQNATQEQKIVLRKKLFMILEANFDALKNVGVKLMLFVEPDNKTFLRMHKPDIYGDDVSNVRKGIALVNKTKKRVYGLEAGKISHAFRHIYPIHNEQGNYLGCLDISFSSESIQKTLSDVHNIHTHFLIDKTTLNKRIWEVKNVSSPYKNSFEHDMYLTTKNKKMDHELESTVSHTLSNNQKIINKHIEQKDSFSIFGKHHEKASVISFIPIDSIVKRKYAAGYIVSYTENESILSIETQFLFTQFIAILTIFLLLMYFYNILMQRKVLRVEIEKKTKELLESKEEAEKAVERFNKTVLATEDGIWDWNLVTNTLYFSPTWQTMLGYEVGELEETVETWQRLLHPDDMQRTFKLVEDFLSNKIDEYRIEFRLLCKDGSYKWVLARAKDTEHNDEGRITRIVGTHVDIQKSKDYEDELKLAKEEAEKATEVKSQFLANMSHEIRTPMNGVLGFLEQLSKSETDSERKKKLDIAKNSGEQLINIINDILDFSKIESGKMDIDPHPCNVNEMFNNSFNIFSETASKNNITLNYDIDKNMPQCILSDSTRLQQVGFNLISNAIKFTENGGEIKIIAKYNGNTIYFAVEDTGIGISKEKLEHIFEAFTQEDRSTTRKYGGTGLGLAISSNILKLMNSELKVESELSKGSKFYFELPVELCDENIESSINSEDKNRQMTFNAHALIVEDNKTNQMLMSLILDDMKVTYDIAYDGIGAIEYFNNNKYDIILMDENMPNMNGIEATKHIRNIEVDKSLKKTPIVAVTANALNGDREKFIDAGMDDYITKPYSEMDIVSVFKKYFLK